jgi:hypothetical protein
MVNYLNKKKNKKNKLKIEFYCYMILYYFIINNK